MGRTTRPNRPTILHAGLLIVLGLAVLLPARPARGAAKQKKLPSFAKIHKAVLRHFEKVPGYSPGGIIARGEVKPLFKEFKRMGWLVADRKEILQLVLADDDFLIHELRTKDGRNFTAKISQYHEGFDAVDHLRRLPRGEHKVRELIHGQDGRGGYRMIEYMTTNPQQRNMSPTEWNTNLRQYLKAAPGGEDFDKPTGRLYTVDLLLGRIEKSYHEACKGARRK